MRVHAVIVTWNAEEFIGECLSSLLTEPQIETVIVVDNDSADATVAVIEEQFPQVELIRAESNGGFSVGCNLGITAAMEAGAEGILLLNPDASIAPGSVALLTGALADDLAVGVVAPKIVTREVGSATPRIRYVGGTVDIAKGVVYSPHWGEADAGQHRGATTTGVLTGCAFLIRTSTIEQVGLMDETFFLYWEDTEYSLRLARAGVPMRVILDATVAHDGSRSTGATGGMLIHHYMERNRLRLMVEHGGRSRLGAIITRVPHDLQHLFRLWRLQGRSGAWMGFRGKLSGVVAFLRRETGRSKAIGS